MHFGISLERCHEAKADGLDHRIDQVANVPTFQRLDTPVHRVESLAKIRNHHHSNVSAAQLPGDLEIGLIDAQHHLRASLHCGTNLGWLEAVDTHPHSGLAQLAHHGAQFGEGETGSTADV